MPTTVLLLGYGETGPFALRALHGTFTIPAVVVPPRSQRAHPVEATAGELGVPLEIANDLAALHAMVESHKPDAVVISSYDRVIPAATLALSRFINVHHGDLPRWRGRANINWAIIAGRQSIALTIHDAGAELDAGDIHEQIEVEIHDDDTVATVYAKFNAIIERTLGDVIARILAGGKGRPQAGRATYCCTRLPKDGLIDWSRSTTEVRNLVRAVTRPFPGAFTFFRNEPLVIWAVERPTAPRVFEGRVPGRVVGIEKGRGVEVLTGDGSLIITSVHWRGQDRNATEVLRSTKDTLGLDVVDLLARVKSLEDRLSGADLGHDLPDPRKDV